MELFNRFAALLLPLLIFSYWALIGHATLGLLRSQRNVLQNMLLAPAIGIAMSLLPIYSCSFFANVPVKQCAMPISIILLLLSSIVLYWRRTAFPFRRYWPFIGVFLLNLALVGRPLWSYGFDWTSYSNDDMANYCFGALWFLNHGYHVLPDISQNAISQNYSSLYWFMFNTILSRPGCELALAWLSAIFQLTPLQLFMPMIVALNLALLSTSTAMIYFNRRWYCPALLLSLAVCFSALTSLGTLYQLIAQVTGLCLLAASLTIVTSLKLHLNKKYIAAQCVLLAILAAALLIDYPEALPFAVLALGFYLLINVITGQLNALKLMAVCGIALLLSTLLVGEYFLNACYFLYHQISGNINISSTDYFLFPFYLIPSGLANLWGLLPIGLNVPEPILSFCIVCGGLLLILAALMTGWLIVRHPRFAPAYLTAVMLFLGIFLFIKKSDFGLFKLAMYLQPFLLATLIGFLFLRINNRRIMTACIVLLILSNIFSQHYYLIRSKAISAGSLNEIVFGSDDKINREYTELVAALPTDSQLITNDFNLSLIKLQIINSIGRKTAFCTFPIFYNIINPLPLVFQPILPHIGAQSIDFFNQANALFVKRNFNLHNAYVPFSIDPFEESVLCNRKDKNTFLVIDQAKRTILNRSQLNAADPKNFKLLPLQQARNILTFISSAQGPIYYALMGNHKSEVTFFNLEGDWFYPQSSGQSLGRYLLFRIFNPTPNARLVINMTTTLKGDGINQLPRPIIIGKQRYEVPVVGRGSARVFSPPIEPQIINQNDYIEIDMQQDGKKYPNHKPGLMKLFGTSINIDPRNLVVFGRNISLLSAEEYQNLSAPTAVKNFPADLNNQNLEYSGIYEDGWLSENAFVGLMAQRQHTQLVLRGQLPKIITLSSPMQLTLHIDGQPVYVNTLLPGNFEIKIPLAKHHQGRKKIELHFSNIQRLPQGDNRPIAAKLEFIGFV